LGSLCRSGSHGKRAKGVRRGRSPRAFVRGEDSKDTAAKIIAGGGEKRRHHPPARRSFWKRKEAANET